MARGAGRKDRTSGTFGSVDKLRHRLPGPVLRPRRAPAPGTHPVPHQGGRPRLALAAAVPRSSATRGCRRRPSRPARLTFADYAERWLAQRELKPRTREHYRKLLDQHLLPAFGPTPLTSITADDGARLARRDGHAATPTLRSHATACCAPSWPPPSVTGSCRPTRAISGAPGPPSADHDPPADAARAGQAHRRRCPSVPGNDPAGVLVRAAVRRADRAAAARRRVDIDAGRRCHPRRAGGGAHR